MSQGARLFHHQALDGVTIVFLDGEIDISCAELLTDQLVQTLVETDAPLVIDLTDVAFFDSSALGALVRAHHVARAAGGSIRLVGPNPRLARLLSITQIDRALPVHDSLESALAAVSSPVHPA